MVSSPCQSDHVYAEEWVVRAVAIPQDREENPVVLTGRIYDVMDSKNGRASGQILRERNLTGGGLIVSQVEIA